MITDRSSLRLYLAEDAKHYSINTGTRKPRLFRDEVWRFVIALRHMEYYVNTRPRRIAKFIWGFRYHRLKIKLGFDIPVNTFGPGLCIRHWGCIVVNPLARIGCDCIIQQGVNIGRNNREYEVPVIGDNVYIGPGAKIFGKIRIGDNIAIGANAVVNRDFTENGVTIAGVPARVIGKRKAGLN